MSDYTRRQAERANPTKAPSAAQERRTENGQIGGIIAGGLTALAGLFFALEAIKPDCAAEKAQRIEHSEEMHKAGIFPADIHDHPLCPSH